MKTWDEIFCSDRFYLSLRQGIAAAKAQAADSRFFLAEFMKLNNRYSLREIAGKGVLMPASVSDPSVRTGAGALRAITLSGSASWLLKNFDGCEFTFDEAVDALCDHYEADRETIVSDVSTLLDTLRSFGALED